jgi:O-antigen ligase
MGMEMSVSRMWWSRLGVMAALVVVTLSGQRSVASVLGTLGVLVVALAVRRAARPWRTCAVRPGQH